MTHWGEMEVKLASIHEDLVYLRSKVDKLEERLSGIIWKVTTIGAGSGALGFVIALVFNKML